MKKLLVILCFWFTLTGAIGFASGIQIDSLISGIRDPYTDTFLANGLVYTYAAGTTASKSVYMDAAMATPSTNPVVLDAYGRALRFAKGKYKFVIKTPGGTTLWTLDNLEYDSVATLASKTANPFGPTMSVTNFSTPNLTATAAANFSMNGYKITNLATPTSAYDAATYQYVASEVSYLTAATSSSTASISSTTSYALSQLDLKIASITPAIPNAPALASTAYSYTTHNLLVGSGSWITIDSQSFTNTTPDDQYYRIDMQGSIGLYMATSTMNLQAGADLGLVDSLGQLYDFTRSSFQLEYANLPATPTGDIYFSQRNPFTLSTYVKVAPGETKILSLAYKDVVAVTSTVLLSTGGRWVKWMRVK